MIEQPASPGHVQLFDLNDLASGNDVAIPTAANPFPHCIVYGFVIYADAFGRRFKLGFGAERTAHQRWRTILSAEYNYVRRIDAAAGSTD